MALNTKWCAASTFNDFSLMISGLSSPAPPYAESPRAHSQPSQDARYFESGLTGVDIELNRSGAHDCTIGHHLGSFEVPLQVGVLHELDIAEIREALAAHRVVRGIDAHTEIEPREIVDGIFVFAAG